MLPDEHRQAFSRGEAIRRGGLAAGAVIGLGAAGPYLRKALALAGDNDVDTLNLLLKFEYLEIQLYEEAATRLNASAELKQLFQRIAEQEHQHVAALAAQIRKLEGKPFPKRDYGTFGYRPSYVDPFLRLARELETAGIGAYNGAIPLIKSREAQELATSILAIEGRHAATVALEGGEDPAPDAFDPVRTEFQALNSVLRFVGSAGFE